MKLRLIVDEYIGRLFKQDSLGRWRKVGQIGNAGVALSFVDILRRVGHEVEVIEEVAEDIAI